MCAALPKNHSPRCRGRLSQYGDRMRIAGVKSELGGDTEWPQGTIDHISGNYVVNLKSSYDKQTSQ